MPHKNKSNKTGKGREKGQEKIKIDNQNVGLTDNSSNNLYR